MIVCLGLDPLNTSTLLVQVRPFNLEERKTIRDLNPCDIDKLICVDGMVWGYARLCSSLAWRHG